ncbi:MAG: alpha-L-fucosidase [Saprospiraceae bacterium]|nr:alpha-L-fucosidase [Saprospiraceae bacterium]MCB9322294.1 alpha-L-fucosidase [Lewinellaceae bacterium]
MNKILLSLSYLFLLFSCSTPPPPPVLPVPSDRQLAWQHLEFYAFIHFNMNTFTNMEWGTGGEDPLLFNPTKLDCMQWAKVCKSAGLKGIILTAKHHDGFCLWPSEYTEHSVKNSPWKNGQGDVLKELSEACKAYDLKFGVYLSPWDRNHADYGKPEYITYFRNQLTELLTNYGEVFEVWFDGANGGTGYYGGANEERRVDKLTYYDWPATYELVRQFQPNAVIFSDAGPDVRWVGNEQGHAYPTTWSNLMRDSIYGGMPEYSSRYSPGQENGTHWVPAEVDVSIRPGWYYHPEQDSLVKSLPELLDIYYNSVGQNGSLLLNFPVDTRGLIHENDVEQLNKLAARLQKDFAVDLAKGQKVEASNVRGTAYKGNNTVDGNDNTYWATEDEVIQANLTLLFDKETTFNRFLIQEYIPLGQRVKAFSLEAKTTDGWVEIAKETTIGYKRMLRLPDITATAIRLNIEDSKACPVISGIRVYYSGE